LALPARPPLSPYTTLFRSCRSGHAGRRRAVRQDPDGCAPSRRGAPVVRRAPCGADHTYESCNDACVNKSTKYTDEGGRRAELAGTGGTYVPLTTRILLPTSHTVFSNRTSITHLCTLVPRC